MRATVVRRSSGYPAAVSSTAAPAPSVVIEPDRGLAPRPSELWTFLHVAMQLLGFDAVA